MASSTTKKVQIHRFDRESLSGYVIPATYLTPSGIELLLLTGSAAIVPYAEVKFVAFVREFDEAESDRRAFLTRPKVDGLWVRLRFRDEDLLEGVLPNNLLQLESQGFTITPPDPNRKLFVPRTALAEVQVLGVIGSPLTAAKRVKKAVVKEQIKLFD